MPGARDSDPVSRRAGRGESELERLDRNLDELLQELRVVQMGVQVLFAFLLTVPFSARFGDVGVEDRAWYFVALVLAGAAAIVLMAPSAQHRMLFRAGEKRVVVRWANRCAIVGTILVAGAILAALVLVTGVLYGSTVVTVGVVAAIGVLAFGLWFVLPLRLRRVRPHRAAHVSTAVGDG